MSGSVQVLYMNSNSVAHIYKILKSPLHNQTILAGISIHDSHLQKSGILNIPDLTIIPDRPYVTLDQNSSIVDYTVTAKNNLHGIYALAIESCGLTPFVVGLNESEINPLILLQFTTTAYSCPAITANSVHESTKKMTGIISKDIMIDFMKLNPNKQQQLGISGKDVQCKLGFELILKAYSNSAICVTPDTASKLVERGWATKLN